MSRRHLKAFGVILVAELALLAVVVAIVLDRTRPTEFPPSISAGQLSVVRSKSSVPVSVNVRVIGETTTAALKARGGRAESVPGTSDAGFVRNRP